MTVQRPLGHAQHLGGLFHTHACEIAKVDKLRLERVFAFQLRERFVQRQHFLGRRSLNGNAVIQFYAPVPATALRAQLTSRLLDEDVPLWVPIPPLAEVQLALEGAVADITQLSGYELKRIMRTGTVASTDNRNWELRPQRTPMRRFSQSRAIALDMESATIAANGFRFRIPYGTLLCVSDKPLHGEIKLPGMANQFYRERVDQHLRIGMHAIELLRQQRPEQLHSRKLRSFAEVAFQ